MDIPVGSLNVLFCTLDFIEVWMGWWSLFLFAKTKQTMKLGKASALFHYPHLKNMF